MFVKGFKKLFKQDKESKQKKFEKFYKLLKASKYKSKQAKKSFRNLKSKEKLLENNCKREFYIFEMFSGKAKCFIKAYTH